jgi:hypothetical protein
VCAYSGELAQIEPAKWLAGLQEKCAGRVVLSTGSMLGLARSIAAGVGVGVLPCFLGDAEPTLRRAIEEPIGKTEVWLVVHPDMGHGPSGPYAGGHRFSRRGDLAPRAHADGRILGFIMRAPTLLLAVSLAASLSFGCKKSNPDGTGGGGGSGSTDSPALASLLNGFEGEIDITAKDKSNATPTPFTLFAKTGKLRGDIPEKLVGARGANMLGPHAYVIFDSTAKKIEIVSDAQKQAMVIDLNKSGEQLKGLGGGGGMPHGGGGSAPQGPTTKITKTGKYDTVAGYKCENWDVTSDHKEGTVCVAQEGISWFSIPMTGIPTEHLWAMELMDGKHFPLRFVGYEKDGTTEEARVEVTKIDKKSLPDAQFTYPPTYKVIDLGQMLAGLGGMPGMPGAMPGGMPGGMPSGWPPGAGPHARPNH